MSNVKVLSQYYSERFKIFPWLFIPAIMGIMIEAKVGMLSFYILISLLFYRLFDDVMMVQYDQAQKGNRKYYALLGDLKKTLWIPTVVYLSYTYRFYGIDGVAMSLIFMLLCLNLYHYFEGKKISSLISVTKYLFLGIIATSTLTPWVFICFTLFLVFELIAEEFMSLPKALPYLLFIIVISLRILWSQT